jgi:hypothetical protein
MLSIYPLRNYLGRLFGRKRIKNENKRRRLVVPPFQFFRMYSFGSRLVYNCRDLSVFQFQATLIFVQTSDFYDECDQIFIQPRCLGSLNCFHEVFSWKPPEYIEKLYDIDLFHLYPR